MSFLNVPEEADPDKMTRFTEQHFTVVAEPYYPKEDYEGLSGTRVYQCKKQVMEHLPHEIKIFGRYVRVTYNVQLDATDVNNDNLTGPEDGIREDESIQETNKNQPNTPQPNNTTEQTTAEQQQTTDPDETPLPTDVHTPIVTKSTKNSNPQQTNIIENQKTQTVITNQLKIIATTEHSPITVPETPAPELEEGKITDDEDMMSPAVIPKNSFATPIIKPDAAINEAARFCVQLHGNNFCDLGKVQKIPPAKRRKIIGKAMLLELAPYDPSDDAYIKNYRGNKIIEIYKRITELKLYKSNLYKQIYHQLTYTYTLKWTTQMKQIILN